MQGIGFRVKGIGSEGIKNVISTFFFIPDTRVPIPYTPLHLLIPETLDPSPWY